MTMKTAKDTVKVKLDIRLGPVTPHQRAAWRRFWQRLRPEVKGDAKG